VEGQKQIARVHVHESSVHGEQKNVIETYHSITPGSFSTQ